MSSQEGKKKKKKPSEIERESRRKKYCDNYTALCNWPQLWKMQEKNDAHHETHNGGKWQ